MVRAGRFVREMKLERFSAQFVRALLDRHPEWQSYVGCCEVEVEGYTERFLEVRVPSEHPRVGEPLLIITDRAGITLDWAGWHDHVYAWPSQGEAGQIADALAKIDLWISDTYLFATIYQGDKGVREWGCQLGETPGDEPGPGERMTVRSWRGTHDRAEG